MTTRWLRNFGFTLAAITLPLAPAFAQDVPPPDDQEEDASSIVVTGSIAVRQGGAQNVSHFRSTAANLGMPRPEALSAEGLMGEHDLTLPSTTACAQLFCVVTESMIATLPMRPADRLFVGLGFTSNVEAAKWHRAPLNLVAVVDKSGSMNGQPLALVRASLKQIVNQMQDGDRLSIVLYGSDVELHLQPTDYAGHKGALLHAIDSIASEGSTYMEAGLRLGYDTAFADAGAFKGNTRVMLFTDEQPNVGNTDAESFMGMAEAASHKGIGLTTIGVGVQFDDTLATRIASVRGGNMFFVANPEEVRSVFARQLDTMVSELAHDLVLTMKPAPGYRIAGVFGVPDGVMTDAPEGAVTVTVPTVFVSTNGGGIYATLAKDGDHADLPAAAIRPGTPLLDVALSYRSAADGREGSSQVAVAAPSAAPSMPLREAHMLVDQYTVMREAASAFHERNEPKTSFALLTGLAARLKGAGIPDLAREQKLTGDMLGYAAFYSGYTGELPKAYRHTAVVGTWKVVSASGLEDVARGDEIEFTDDQQLLTTRHSARDDASERYEINEAQIRLVESDTVFRYTTRGDELAMVVEDGDGAAQMTLKRVAE